MKRFSRAVSLGAAGALALTGLLAFPATPSHAAYTFPVTVKVSGEGEARQLTWTHGCESTFGGTPAVTYTLKRGAETLVSKTSAASYTIGDRGGDYTVIAECAPDPDFTPETFTSTGNVHVDDAAAPATPPADPAPAPSDPAPETPGTQTPNPTQPDAPQPTQPDTPPAAEGTDLAFVYAGFSETATGRTLSWNVTGCDVMNEKTVEVTLLHNGVAFPVRADSRKDQTNASQFPTGVYTVRATCTDFMHRENYGYLDKEVTLTRANLQVTFAGDPLHQLIPRPGDTVSYSSIASHNGIRPVNGSTPGAFQPGEKVTLAVALNDGEATVIETVTADTNGNIAGTITVPDGDENTRSFTVIATGQTTGYQLDYRSVVTTPDLNRIEASTADLRDHQVRVWSPPATDVYTFLPGKPVTLTFLSQDGTKVFETTTTASEVGSIDLVVDLPKELTPGRYTVKAPAPLGFRDFYATYFTLAAPEATTPPTTDDTPTTPEETDKPAPTTDADKTDESGAAQPAEEATAKASVAHADKGEAKPIDKHKKAKKATAAAQGLAMTGVTAAAVWVAAALLIAGAGLARVARRRTAC